MTNKIISYPKDWNFKEAVEKIFEVKDLSKIHTQLKSQINLVNVNTDQDTPLHKIFYNKKDEEFMKLYKKFIKEFVRPYYNEPIIYQKIPTFRIQFPNKLSVGDFHKDKDYNHSSNEINWWIPLTHTFRTNTIWIESKEDKKDYKPFKINMGEILIFNGANYSHGNKINKTKSSRVSFDFRIIPKRLFKSEGKKTLTHNVKLDIGGYFEEMK